MFEGLIKIRTRRDRTPRCQLVTVSIVILNSKILKMICTQKYFLNLVMIRPQLNFFSCGKFIIYF